MAMFMCRTSIKFHSQESSFNEYQAAGDVTCSHCKVNILYMEQSRIRKKFTRNPKQNGKYINGTLDYFEIYINQIDFPYHMCKAHDQGMIPARVRHCILPAEGQ